jgi:hypothetical protein
LDFAQGKTLRKALFVSGYLTKKMTQNPKKTNVYTNN